MRLAYRYRTYCGLPSSHLFVGVSRVDDGSRFRTRGVAKPQEEQARVALHHNCRQTKHHLLLSPPSTLRITSSRPQSSRQSSILRVMIASVADDELLDSIAFFLNDQAIVAQFSPTSHVDEQQPQKRPQRPRHIEIRLLRDEISQLQALRDVLQSRQAEQIDRADTEDLTEIEHWKAVAKQQLHLREASVQTNLELRQCVRSNAALTTRARRQVGYHLSQISSYVYRSDVLATDCSSIRRRKKSCTKKCSTQPPYCIRAPTLCFKTHGFKRPGLIHVSVIFSLEDTIRRSTRSISDSHLSRSRQLQTLCGSGSPIPLASWLCHLNEYVRALLPNTGTCASDVWSS